MRINKFKNLIGLCACKGCFKFYEVNVDIAAEREDGTQVIKRKFRLCQACSLDYILAVLPEEEY